ncbi:MAG: TIGR00269 family protein [Candidatus Parvarchaeota archaeon]|nr:TIGR00269 family protein [Candidatus Parvarchaeota archaeon]MCL5106792.1 TIGR00269 family protein [Candidatus Parvarchaeota archaeon]
MECEICGSEAVISTNNGTLCAEHFKQRFEEITLSTIKRYGLIKKGERIAVANSGGKDSLSLLYILSKYFKKSNEIVSITIDEGIKGYRDKTIEIMKDYCNKYEVEYKIYSYKDFAGRTMDSITKTRTGIPCSACGVLRRYLINYAASEVHADKVATAHNMDDEAENVIMNLVQNDIDKMVRLGAYSGIIKEKGFVPRIKPFLFLNEKETMLFSMLNGINAIHTPCPYAGMGFRGLISRKIKQMETEFTGSKRNVINAMLEIKKGYSADSGIKMNKCRYCGFPSANDICEACKLKEELVKSPVV